MSHIFMVKSASSPFEEEPIEYDQVYRFEATCVSIFAAMASLFFLKCKLAHYSDSSLVFIWVLIYRKPHF
jgi:hypothetical protein